ncbi:MAG: beta-galactosidase GalB [Bacteroidota bacterium]|nr:beta-galactosidase GalB [Bacteroidota bacterium]
MRKITHYSLLFLLLPISIFAGESVRKEYTLEKNWKFTKGDVTSAMTPSFNDAKWQSVSVPHDWAIYGPFAKSIDAYSSKIVQNNENKETMKTGRTGSLPFIGVGWYRLKFSVPEFSAGKKVTLLFDGAMSNAQVYINGKEVGRWPYGYSSFHFDITPFLKSSGENILAVRLENKERQSRWYPGAGLYRNVHLIVSDETHIPVWGTYITTPKVSAEFAKVNIKTQIATTASINDLKIETEILDAKGESVAKSVRGMNSFDEGTLEQSLIVTRPSLWSPETPSLYTAVTKVYQNDVLKDTYSTRFGIREIKYESMKGFSLNGKIRKFKGVCLHHDLGPLGAAINKAAIRRQLVILKDMGCDAIRTSHNPPAPELLDLCDEMGFLVMDESFDTWKSPKVENGYQTLFNDWAEKDMVTMIHRDRNHPSIVMWSIGNEIGEQSVAGGNKVLKYLQDICHREDPTRPVTAGMDRLDNALKNNFAALLDIPGFNYKPGRYEEAAKVLPQGMILGSETASTVSSRGVYKFPVEFGKDKQYPDNQCSSYDFEACNWSQVPDDEFVKQDDLDYVIGEFVWTGFDYLGEPTPYDEYWPSRSSYFGICDLAGLPKDRYYLYRSRWNTSANTIHILPHWTWPGREGQVTPVFCYTNYPSAELFVNGKSMGKQMKSKENNQTRYRLMWKDVKYEPGTLKVVAYDEAGKAVATEEVHTAGKPHHIELVADRNQLTADGKDLAFVTVKVVDEKGNLCPDADNLLKFSVIGAGSYRAAANGDATSLEQFHLPQMHVFKGMLTAVVQASEKSGKMVFKVESKGLNAGVLSIETK